MRRNEVRVFNSVSLRVCSERYHLLVVGMYIRIPNDLFTRSSAEINDLFGLEPTHVM